MRVPPAVVDSLLTHALGSSHSENTHWEEEHPSLNEMLIALCASYQALARYISGADIYLMPRSVADLESKLCVLCLCFTLLRWCADTACCTRYRRRYAYDAIHNMIAQSKSPLERGGYSRVRFD